MAYRDFFHSTTRLKSPRDPHVRWQEPQSCLMPSRAWMRFHDRRQPFIFSSLSRRSLPVALCRITIRRREIGSVFDIRHDEERNVIIVGAGHLAWFYIRLLDSFAIDNRRAVGILDDNESLHGGSMFGHVILGGTAEAATVLDDFAQHGIEISAFVICEPNKERALALSNRLESLCQDRGLQFELLAEKLGVLKDPSEEEAGDRPTLRPIFPKSNYFHIKRPIEATIATFALLILSPLFILVGLLVLISLGSPVLFWQRRVGRNGRTIWIYKFKTMYNTIDRTGRLLRESARLKCWPVSSRIATRRASPAL